MTSVLSKDLLFLILQFLDEEKFKESIHKLEQESGLYFNFKYFEDLVLNGDLDDVEKYLSGFTKIDDNRFSMKIFFEIRKQKYLEALDKRDHPKATEILIKDLKVFESFNEELFKEITYLLTLDNFRENDQLSSYIDTKTARTIIMLEIKKLLEANPLLREKLQFPNIEGARLRTLINQSLNWQHSLCGNDQQNPDIKTLFVDHTCKNSSDVCAQATQLVSSNQAGAPEPVSIAKSESFLPMVANRPFHPTIVPLRTSLATWLTSPSLPMPHPPVVTGVPRNIGDLEMSKQMVSAASDRLMLTGNNSSQNSNNMTDELPKTLAQTLNQGSVPTSMDFHPVQQTLLLVGTGPSDITLPAFESHSQVVTRLGIAPETSNKSVEISDPTKLKTIKLPCHIRADKIAKLIYTHSGTAMVALATSGIHFLWRWPRNERHLSGTATTKVVPHLTQPISGTMMINDVVGVKLEEAVHCFALSKNDSYIMSTSGRQVSLFNAMTFKTMATLMALSPRATSFIFHPRDNNVIAVGMDDAMIIVYNVRMDEVKGKLQGHTKRVTGLDFSSVLNALVSSGQDYKIIVWNAETWERLCHCFMPMPVGRISAPFSDTHVQFHSDQIHLLAVHESQLCIFETTKLECIKQWVTGETSSRITYATFSCDSQLIYSTFMDGTLRIFNASNLQVQCLIKPSAYIPSNISCAVYPPTVAAHPQEPNQFAIGLTNGGVYIFEPLESDGNWGVPQPAENEPATSATPGPPIII